MFYFSGGSLLHGVELRNVIFRRPGKLQRNKCHRRNGYKVLKIVIHCVLKCGFDSVKIATN